VRSKRRTSYGTVKILKVFSFWASLSAAIGLRLSIPLLVAGDLGLMTTGTMITETIGVVGTEGPHIIGYFIPVMGV
jgi:hypothetical protein